MTKDESSEEIHELFSMSGAEATAEEPESALDGVDAPPQIPHGERLPTGIDLIDRHLDGGFPLGRVVAFVAPPDSQSELVLKELVTQRNTLYISTFRPHWEVQEEILDHVQKRNRTDLPNQVRIEHVSAEDFLANPDRYLDQLGKRSNLIVDSINDLESADRDRYVDFLIAVKRRLWETGSVGLFYGIDDEPNPAVRSLTLKRADIVWKLRMSIDKSGIRHLLVISKFRGGRALTEPIKLILTDRVHIDSSRDIV